MLSPGLFCKSVGSDKEQVVGGEVFWGDRSDGEI
jgi:hypothetical protein